MIFSEKTIWMSWHNHPRSRKLSSLLGIRFMHFSKIKSGIWRHVIGFLWASVILSHVRPKTIFLQNSFLLLLACVIYKIIPFTGKITIINDCHNKSLKRQIRGRGGTLFRKMKQWCFANVDCVIISNSKMLLYAEPLCSSVAILRDPLGARVLTESIAPATNTSNGYVLFVCSFEADEPIDAIKLSISELSNQWEIPCIVTGHLAAHILGSELASSSLIQCPGFIPYSDYWELLTQADVVVVLTSDDDCLVCGGYEALTAERPLVLSDTSVLRQVFGDGAVYTLNEAAAITEAVRNAINVPANIIANAKIQFNKDIAYELKKFTEIIAFTHKSKSDQCQIVSKETLAQRYKNEQT